MKKMRKVDAIEVKRTYLIADAVRRSERGKEFLGLITPETYRRKLASAKRAILKLSERKLDAMIARTYPRRLVAFEECDWYLGTFSPREVGVWRRAGNLPLEWSNRSLVETAEHVKKALERNSRRLKGRVRSTVPSILHTNVEHIQSERYLLPIVFEGGTGTKGRRRLRTKMTGDIDDGCMRSIALTIAGATAIKAYLGFPRAVLRKSIAYAKRAGVVTRTH